MTESHIAAGSWFSIAIFILGLTLLSHSRVQGRVAGLVLVVGVVAVLYADWWMHV